MIQHNSNVNKGKNVADELAKVQKEINEELRVLKTRKGWKDKEMADELGLNLYLLRHYLRYPDKLTLPEFYCVIYKRFPELREKLDKIRELSCNCHNGNGKN